MSMLPADAHRVLFKPPRLTDREIANHIAALARTLSYDGPLREGNVKHRLFELASRLGGTGVPAAPHA